MPKRLRGFTAGTSAAARSASSARSAASLAHGPHSRSRSPGHEDRIVSCQRSSVNTTPVPVGTARRPWSSCLSGARRDQSQAAGRAARRTARGIRRRARPCVGPPRSRGRRRQAGAAGRPRPAAGLDAGVRAARVLRPARRYSAGRDPVVGGALRLLHEEPAAPVASLASRAGVSRATLAKRFTDLVGEPPLTYLTRWRMTLAADSPAPWATPTRSRSARRSNEPAASAPARIGALRRAHPRSRPAHPGPASHSAARGRAGHRDAERAEAQALALLLSAFTLPGAGAAWRRSRLGAGAAETAAAAPADSLRANRQPRPVFNTAVPCQEPVSFY